MFTLIGKCAGWLARKGVVLVTILAILIALAWIRSEWIGADKVKGEIAALESRYRQGREELDAMNATAARMGAEVQATLAALRTELAELHGYKLSIEDSLSQARSDRRKLMDEHFLKVYIPGTEPWWRKQAADLYIAQLRQVVATKSDAIRLLETDPRWKKVEELARSATDSAKDVLRKTSDLDALRARIDSRKADYESVLFKQETFDRFQSVIQAQLPVALMLLVLVIVTPIGIKLLVYFVIAPQVSRFRPIRLLPETSGSILAQRNGSSGPDPSSISAVSVPITLAEGTELLVRSDYLQSTSVHGRKSTQWLLNARHPLSSVLAGMYMLTRIGATGGHPIVVSSQRDPLSEVCVLELPAGSAMVCQPRALAGVIKSLGEDVRITRHWRLGSLHAWLTLQLRYLVFHGPCSLLLKGCRGVRIEAPDSGRLINQAATLGFSANLAYSNRRCETFVSYWTGEEDLFNDLFSGKDGFIAYEVIPSRGRKAGAGRGLEGVVDAFLKAFGI